MKRMKKDGTQRRADIGIYIFGRRTVMIDGSAELYDYTDAAVLFRPEKGGRFINIIGRGLTVKACGNEACEVSGVIDGVEFVKGNGNA